MIMPNLIALFSYVRASCAVLFISLYEIAFAHGIQTQRAFAEIVSFNICIYIVQSVFLCEMFFFLQSNKVECRDAIKITQ